MQKTRKLGIPVVLVLVLIIPTCGPPGTPTDMDEFLRALQSWEEFAPPQEDSDVQIGDPVLTQEAVNGTDYNCNSTPYSITRTPDKIATLNPDSEILWVGALLQGKGHLEGIGSLAELPIRQRSPMTLSIDLLTTENTQTVELPDLASVNQAVGRLIQQATDADHRAGSKISFNQVTSHSVEEAALRLGFSASYQGVTVKASLETSVSAETSTVTASYIQQMFTVSVVLPQTPGEFFGDDFTETLRDEQADLGRMGDDNLPVFVSSIVYGRMLMFSFTARATAEEIRGALEIGAGNVAGGELSAEQRTILETGEMGLVAVGGDAANAQALIRSGDLASYFEEDSALTTGRPISYTIRNLADNSIARVGETTEYNLKECVPEDVEPTGAKYIVRIDSYTYQDTTIPCGCEVIGKRNLNDIQYEFKVNGEDVVSFGGEESITCTGTNTVAKESEDVELHFDVRDTFSMDFQLTDRGRTWVWREERTKMIPVGDRNEVMENSTGLGCYWMRLKWNIQKTGDLFD